MDISSLPGFSSTQQQQNVSRATSKLRSVIETLVSGSRLNQASDDVAALSIASQLQSQTSGLKQISSNLAQASSLTQVADGGIEQIQGALEQLKSLAQQASNPTLNAENREQLNNQFKELTKEIDRLASTTGFNGKSLLNGDISGDNTLSIGSLLSSNEANDQGESLSIDNLSSASLFSGQSLNLQTADGAAQAFAVIGEALGKTISARASVGTFQQSIDFVAANIDSAVVNQEAARSELQDTDFAQASTLLSLFNVQRDAGIALAAQGNRLSPALLKLVG